MLIRRPTLLLLALTAAACSGLVEEPDNSRPLGFITASARKQVDGSYTVRPEASFYSLSDAGFNTPPADSCRVLPYSAAPQTASGLNSVSAGPYVATLLRGRSDTLRPVSLNGERVYQLAGTAGIPFVPGDTLQAMVPGAEFPALTIKARTAEAFTHDPVAVPTVGSNLTLKWTAAPVPGSLMIFSLRYATTAGNGALNEQLYCAFADDGEGTVRAVQLLGWQQAVGGNRQVVASRLRTRVEVGGSSGSTLTIISTFEVPTPAP